MHSALEPCESTRRARHKGCPRGWLKAFITATLTLHTWTATGAVHTEPAALGHGLQQKHPSLLGKRRKVLAEVPMRPDASVPGAAEPVHQWKLTNKRTNTGLIWACGSSGTSQAYRRCCTEGMELLEITRKGAESRIPFPEVFVVPSHCPIL